MLSSGKPLPIDHYEVAKQTRARLFDEERKKRIFNPASRTIGVSYFSHHSLINDITLFCIRIVNFKCTPISFVLFKNLQLD